MTAAEQHDQLLAMAGVYCQWVSSQEMNLILDDSFQGTDHDDGSLQQAPRTVRCDDRGHFGALKLTGNAKVIHVPSYLRGLWNACLQLSKHTAQWIVSDHHTRCDDDKACWLADLQNEFDEVVLAAGAGLFQGPQQRRQQREPGGSELPDKTNATQGSILALEDFPNQLVRGQSVEMERRQRRASLVECGPKLQRPPPALVCGKFILPTLKNDRILVGATHEFESQPWTRDQVLAELRLRTMALLPSIWQ